MPMMGTTMRTAARAALLLTVLLACKGMGESEEENTKAQGRSDEPAAPRDEGADEKSAPQKPNPPPANPLLTLLAGSPKSVGTTKVPIRRAGAFSGAVVSTPTGWSGDKWDPEGVAGPAYEGDIYGDALLFSAPDSYAHLHYKAEVVSGGEPKKYGPVDLKVHAYAAYITKVTWSEPVLGKLGHEDTPAWIWKGEGVGVMKGKGQPWKAYAASVAIGTKNVFVVGSWDASKPEYEAAVIDGMKAIRG
jgi:hypothetical protein